MGEYLRPDVYIEREAKGAEPIQSVGTATAGFIGISPKGVIGKAEFVTSWTEFVHKFARGLSTPFINDSDLAYAVYGYFQNGGGRAFVTRVAGETATKATTVVGLVAEEEVSIRALEEGTWANTNLEVVLIPNEPGVNVDVIVKFMGESVEKYTKVTIDPDSENYIFKAVNGVSKYIEIVSAPTLAEGIGIFSGGLDGIDDIEDTDYLGGKGLRAFDSVEDVNLIAIPGQTSKTVAQGILDYCANRQDCFAILDSSMNLDPTEILAEKKELGGSYGAYYYPWGKVVDPIGKGRLRLVPPSGHIAGIYARTDRNRGVHKAPAGVETQIRGFVEVERPLSNGHIELLNPQGINCIVAKPNRGIVIWGARMMTPHLDRNYVSDIRLDINIEESLYTGTQWVVFEPNDEILWGRIIAQVKAFLYLKWVDGALFGATPEEAFFVKCDEELNTEEVRDAGRVIVEVGYAKKKPAEFTIFRLSQKTASSN